MTVSSLNIWRFRSLHSTSTMCDKMFTNIARGMEREGLVMFQRLLSIIVASLASLWHVHITPHSSCRNVISFLQGYGTNRAHNPSLSSTRAKAVSLLAFRIFLPLTTNPTLLLPQSRLCLYQKVVYVDSILFSTVVF